MQKINRDFFYTVIALCSVVLVIFQILSSGIPAISMETHRIIHVCFSVVLALLFSMQDHNRLYVRIPLAGVLLAAILSSGIILFRIENIKDTVPYTDPVMFVAVAVFLIAVLIATFLCNGIALPLLTIAVIIYIVAGGLIPINAILSGFSWNRLASKLLLSYEGFYGGIVGTVTTYVFTFILYGHVLIAYGLGEYLVNLSEYLIRRNRKRSVYVTILSSFLFGMFSVRSRVNILNTGAVNAPKMKADGYSSDFTGAIIATASGLGRFTPPLFGVIAIFMANRVGLSFGRFILVMLPTSLLIWLGLMTRIVCMTRTETDHDNASEIAGPEGFKIAHGAQYFLSILSLILQVVFARWNLTLSILLSIVVFYLIHTIYALVSARIWRPRADLQRFVNIAVDSCEAAVPITICTACLGIIFTILYTSGLHMRIVFHLVHMANYHPALLLVMIAVFALSIGGISQSVAAYISISSLICFSLSLIGTSDVTAYAFLLVYVCFASVGPFRGDSIVTAARVVGAKPKKIRYTAQLLLLPCYMVPVLFYVHPALLLQGTLPQTLWTFVSCATGIVGLSMLVEAVRLKMSLPTCVFLLVVSICLFSCRIVLFVPAIVALFWFIFKQYRKTLLQLRYRHDNDA